VKSCSGFRFRPDVAQVFDGPTLTSQEGVAEIAIDTSQHAVGFFAHHGFRTTRQVADGFGCGMDQVSMSLLRAEWLALAGLHTHAATFGAHSLSP
jgi:hypothetical protein